MFTTYPFSEILFVSELYKLSQFDLRTLISEKKVSTDLLNCWGHILNRKEEDRAASSPLRFFAYVTSDGVECRYLTNFEKVNLNVRPNIILENRLKVKYCHSILTFHQNQLLNQINTSAKDMRMSMRTRLAGRNVVYSDEHLLKHVLRGGSNDLAKYDVVVNTKWEQATREGMSTLKPRKWVMDMVIDMYGVYFTISNPNFLYIPTTSKFIKTERDSTIGGQYIKMTYMPKDGSTIRKVFMPLSFNKHWFLIVADFDEKCIFVLDSLIDNNGLNEKYKFIAGVVNNVAKILARQKGYEHILEMVNYGQVEVNVPQQQNVFDCGVYVLKWLEVADDRDRWGLNILYKDFDQFRKKVALQLLKWDENARKDF